MTTPCPDQCDSVDHSYRYVCTLLVMVDCALVLANSGRLDNAGKYPVTIQKIRGLKCLQRTRTYPYWTPTIRIVQTGHLIMRIEHHRLLQYIVTVNAVSYKYSYRFVTSDLLRIGRYYSYYIAVAMLFTFSLVTAFSPNFGVYILFRFFIAAANLGSFLIAFVIGKRFESYFFESFSIGKHVNIMQNIKY